MFNTPENYVASGIYIAPPIVAYAVNITNPFYKADSPVIIDTIAEGTESDKLIESLRKQKQLYTIQKPHAFDYASKLVNVARMIKESEYDLVLCPLRGGRLPGLQSQIICNDSKLFRPFDGTDMSRGTNDKRIMEDLRSILFENGPCPHRKIGVLDHAKGGDSCAAMSRLLGRLNADTNEEWKVDFHLLHKSGHPPNRASKAYSDNTTQYQVQVYPIEVSDLLIEDKDDLLGYEVDNSGGQSFSHRLQVEGRLLIIEPGKATLLKAALLDETLIGVVGEEISHVIRNIEDAKLIDPDYWTKLKEE